MKVNEETVYKTLGKDKFEWEEDKNSYNIKVHGISFELAILIFNNDDTVIGEDYVHTVSELRYKAIGVLNGSIITVIFTERGNSTRIISAFLSGNKDRRFYHDYN